MVFVTKFRVNDLAPNNGKQIEFNANVVRDFFGFARQEVEINIECRSLADTRFSKLIKSPLKLSPARGDYKVYQNPDGTPNLKDVFLNDLHLTEVQNKNDYYALYKKSELDYVVYYIPHDLLFTQFFKSVAKDEIIMLSETVEAASNQNVNVAQVDIIHLKEFMEAFIADVSTCGLLYDKQLIERFISGLLAKHFLVLSGLSGSGKTKLAQSFATWMLMNYSRIQANSKTVWFSPGINIETPQGEVRITECNEKSMTFMQSTGTKVCMPYDVINEWVETIRNNGISESVNSNDIKAKVVEDHQGSFSPTLHSFHAPLKALAFYQKNQEDIFLARGGAVGNYAYKTGAYLLVSVGADWTNSEHLLGYPDALQSGQYVMPDTGVLKFMLDARDNPNFPFFLILDEMNLSHVERYFADFLSAMESSEDIKLYSGPKRKAGDIDIPSTLKFPKNLFVIGTMNVDETTYMFSPKVLDRAQVIEFRVNADEMKGFLENPTMPDLGSIRGKGAKYAESFLKLKDNQPQLDASGSANKDAIAEALNKFFPELAKLGAEFGYRTAGEIVRFCAYYLAAGAAVDGAIDAAIVQKLLPKLHGSRRKLELVLAELWKLCRKDDETNELDAVVKAGGDYDFATKAKYPLSSEKVLRMFRSAVANGFASFAEA